MRHRNEPTPPPEDEGPSKTRVKQAMHELQQLGAALMELPDTQLDDIEMAERLRDALHELRRMHAHGARKRQIQYVGKLLRDVDVEPFRRALEAQRSGHAREAAAVREIDAWRERLLAGDDGLANWLKARPESDTPQFRALIARARRERAALQARDARFGGETRNGPAFRELFQILRAELQRATGDVSDA